MSTQHVNKQGSDKEMLDSLLKETFEYFLNQSDPITGLIADKTKQGSPSSISVVGMGLSSYIVGIENNFLSRSAAINKILRVLRFLYYSHQGEDGDATAYKGFYYHFLDMNTGKRAWNCELSTIDTALFIAGALSVAYYFSGNTNEEKEIRKLSDDLYRRVDWQWALDGEETISHGWTPESGFLPYRWDDNYNESMILYMLALGSPTYPIQPQGYKKWTSTFKVKDIFEVQYIYAGPLFIHQFSHLWIDFRGIRDDFNNKVGFDYFENSRRATYVHRKYAIENSKQFKHYGEYFWGLSASNGPGDVELEVDGKRRTFYGYLSRGAPFGPDDGTISPWSVVASLPFAPEIVLDTIRNCIEKFDLKHSKVYGLEASFNPTYPEKIDNPNGWVSPWRFGLNQGAIVLMIENYRSALIWKIMRQCPYLVKGLTLAGFTEGWLSQKDDKII
jgi:hypothetical protein